MSRFLINEKRIKNEVKGAWYSKNFKITITTSRKEWSGTTNSEIKIKGYINQDKTIAFPEYKGGIK